MARVCAAAPSALAEPGSGPQLMNADVSARLAWPDDAPAIARLQADSWRERYGESLPEATLNSLPLDAFAQQWVEALKSPRDARQRVLVGLEGPTVRAFAAVEPSPDPDADPIADAEVAEFTVAAAHRGQGHGSRLLHAVVDTLIADKFTRATWWVAANADDVRNWLAVSGWKADGAHRELESDYGSRLKQVRLHVGLERGE